MTRLRLTLVLTCWLTPMGCQNNTAAPVAYCTAPQSIAVLVTPLDSLSLLSVADSARGIVQSGTYTDSLRRSVGVLTGGTRLGTYQVTVERPGYHLWIRSNVQVTRQGPCGNVEPERLTAYLQRT